MTDIQAITVRLPVELYERLRRRAFTDHRTQTEMVIAGTELYLDQLDERDLDACASTARGEALG